MSRWRGDEVARSTAGGIASPALAEAYEINRVVAGGLAAEDVANRPFQSTTVPYLTLI